MNDAQELVKVAFDFAGNPCYNGYETVHEALWNLEPQFRVLEFADRMILSLDILIDLDTPIDLDIPIGIGKTFMYSFTYDIWAEDTICAVYDKDNPEDPIFEWLGSTFIEKGIMKDEYDLVGLYNHLVKIGEILPDDKLKLINF